MDEEQIERIAAEIMAAPKLKNVTEDIAKHYICRVIPEVLIYCNREDVPILMEKVIASIVEDMLQADLVSEPEKRVQSIGRGDTSITYIDSSSLTASAVSFCKNYERQLNQFRKIGHPRMVRR